MSLNYSFKVYRPNGGIDTDKTIRLARQIQRKAATEWARENGHRSIDDYVGTELDPLIGGLDDTRRTRQN